MAQEIKLSKGLFAIVDDCDADRVRAHSWHAARRVHTTYAASNIKTELGRHYALLHRFVMGAPDGVWVDHINGNGLDNTRANLRFATPEQSARNRAGRGASRFSGVRLIGVRWCAFVSPSGTEIYLGAYPTEELAAAAFNAAARVVYGEFVRENAVTSDGSELAAVIADKRAGINRLLKEISFLEGKNGIIQ